MRRNHILAASFVFTFAAGCDKPADAPEISRNPPATPDPSSASTATATTTASADPTAAPSSTDAAPDTSAAPDAGTRRRRPFPNPPPPNLK